MHLRSESLSTPLIPSSLLPQPSSLGRVCNETTPEEAGLLQETTVDTSTAIPEHTNMRGVSEREKGGASAFVLLPLALSEDMGDGVRIAIFT